MFFARVYVELLSAERDKPFAAIFTALADEKPAFFEFFAIMRRVLSVDFVSSIWFVAFFRRAVPAIELAAQVLIAQIDGRGRFP